MSTSATVTVQECRQVRLIDYDREMLNEKLDKVFVPRDPHRVRDRDHEEPYWVAGFIRPEAKTQHNGVID